MGFMYYPQTACSMIAPKAIQVTQRLDCRSDAQQRTVVCVCSSSCVDGTSAKLNTAVLIQ